MVWISDGIDDEKREVLKSWGETPFMWSRNRQQLALHVTGSSKNAKKQ
jgi:hypothetical protein